jgi:ADP-heptose:LPS heptosyltransferase
MEFKRIMISRTDSIGDVILTLPVAGIIKKMFPSCTIIFLGKSYTKDIVETSIHIDEFIDWKGIQESNAAAQIKMMKAIHADAIIHVFPVKAIARLACKAGIPLRIGTTGRWYHYLYCNKLVPFTRRRSPMHEAQLNLKLIKPFGFNAEFTLDEIHHNYGFSKIHQLNQNIGQLIDKNKFNLILHPKSKGSAREWGIANYSKLITILPEDKFRIFITGTAEEGLSVKKDLIDSHPNIIDLTGKLSLRELISFINTADGLLAASTGPLHIAAALGKHVLGLYPPIKPMHPGRWAPVGIKAEYLVLDKHCSKCRKNHHCECLESITPETVKIKLLSWLND